MYIAVNMFGYFGWKPNLNTDFLQQNKEPSTQKMNKQNFTFNITKNTDQAEINNLLVNMTILTWPEGSMSVLLSLIYLKVG